MRQMWIVMVILLCSSVVFGQAESDTASVDVNDNSDALSIRVLFESAFIRELPLETGTAVASVFENDFLDAIGRNADGTWIQVRRPGREISLGWIARRLIVINFDVTLLPLTDVEAGLIGDEPIIDIGYAIFIPSDSFLRDDAVNNANEILVIPASSTVPVLERTQDLRWVKVNYLGVIGWVSAFNFISSIDLSVLPVAPETQRALANIEIIPPEVQMAQAIRLRTYTQPLYDISNEVAIFWGRLLEGEVRQCAPPTGNYAMIQIVPRDIVELPELRGASRLLPVALADLNASIETMQRCGVYSANELSRAYAQALNARLIFNSTLSQMENVEALLAPQLEQ